MAIELSSVCDPSTPLALRVLRAIALTEAELGRGAYRSEIAGLTADRRVNTISTVLCLFVRSQILHVTWRKRDCLPTQKGSREKGLYTLADKSGWGLEWYCGAVRQFELEYKPDEPCLWRSTEAQIEGNFHITDFSPYRDGSTFVGVRILRFLRDVVTPVSCKAIELACGQNQANSTSASLFHLLGDRAIVRSLCPSRAIWLYELNRSKQSWTEKPSKILRVFDLEFQPEFRRYSEESAPSPAPPNSDVLLEQLNPDIPPGPEMLLAEPTLSSGESIEQLRQQRLWLAIALHQLGVAYVRQCGNPKAGFYDWLRNGTARWLSATTAEASLNAEAWILRRCKIDK